TATRFALMLREAASPRASAMEASGSVRAAMLLSTRAKVTTAFAAASSPLRRLEFGGEPFGARIMAREKADESACRFRHRAVRHQRALVARRNLQQCRHRTSECQPLVLRDFAYVVQPHLHFAFGDQFLEIGRASCRETV